MIWKYGGLEFLLKLARMMDSNSKEVCEIIQFIVGMKRGMFFVYMDSACIDKETNYDFCIYSRRTAGV